ncbi:hypothetical protein G6F68_018807 [Rhizopus microsporus]|nr:hypothetical protein G6F24_016822 [Rhizopus arrhizus]KAG1237516.1 hypothetical protein G6F68_018807 [Rhizopus microsporus]
MRAHAGQLFLPLGAAVALDQRHFVAVLLAHDAVSQQQALTEIGVEQVPVAACATQLRTHQFDLARGERFRGQRGRRSQPFTLQQCLDSAVRTGRLGAVNECVIVSHQESEK